MKKRIILGEKTFFIRFFKTIKKVKKLKFRLTNGFCKPHLSKRIYRKLELLQKRAKLLQRKLVFGLTATAFSFLLKAPIYAQFPSTLNASEIASSGGATILFDDNEGFKNATFTGLGDINGDGHDDYVIGAPGKIWANNPANYIPKIYVIKGNGTAIEGEFNLNDFLADKDYYVIEAADNQSVDTYLEAKGVRDVNGDGKNDMLIRYQNKYYLHYGGSFDGEILNLGNFDATVGQVIDIGQVGFGEMKTYGGAGDINGDGLYDYFIAFANGNYPNFDIYVVYGTTEEVSPTLDLQNIQADEGIKIINAPWLKDVNGAGDYNNDGYDDLVFSTGEERLVLFYGKPDYDGLVQDYADLDNTEGFYVEDHNFQDSYEFGLYANGIGDINGDGFDDISAGFYIYDQNPTKSEIYVIFGSDEQHPLSRDITTLTLEDGIKITNIDGTDYDERGIQPFGDLNCDGYDDFGIIRNVNDFIVILGQPEYNDFEVDYQVLDSTQAFFVDLTLTNWDRNNMITNNIPTDLNGDGASDLLLSTQYSSQAVTADFDRLHVYYGRPAACTGAITTTACNEYTSPSGKYTWIESGIYKDTLQGAGISGCDSIIKIDLTIHEVNITVTQQETTLTANANTGAYQWLDCDNNYAVIPNATQQTFIATEAGNYAVEISGNGCADTSACYLVIINGIADEFWQQLKVYPNPTSQVFYVELPDNHQIKKLQLLDVYGRILQEISPAQAHIEIDVSKNTTGIYFLLVLGKEDEAFTYKVLKQ